jgi:4-amino-4-deoxy-L-arabinose transferase-like glycosyltransferase
MWLSRRPLLALLIIALTVRIGLLWAASSIGLQIDDERQYVQLATNLADGHGFGFEPGHLTSMRPPLYPAFVAATWWLTGSRALLAVRAAQIIVGLGSIVLLYGIVLRLFDRRTALVAAALFGLYPSLLFSGVLILSETLFIGLFLLTIRGCLALFDGENRWAAFGTGVVLGFSALTRSILWPLPAVLIPFLWLASRASMRQKAAVCGLVLAGYAMALGPWAIRNTRLQHTPVLVDTMGGINLLTGNYAFTPEGRMWDGVRLTGVASWSAPLASRPEALQWTVGQKDRWARNAAVEFMTAHPLLTLKRSILKLADLWGLEREWVAGIQQGLYHPPEWFAILSTTLVLCAYPVALLLAVLGFFWVRPADPRAHWFFLLLIVFTSALHAVTFGHSRYHLPLVPVVALYASAALVNRDVVLQQLRVRSRALAPSLIAATCLAIWVREVAFRDAERVGSLLAILRQVL